MSDSIFCLVRQTWVKALPEEKVRQALLYDMTQRLHYPLGYIALEKNLCQLPHVTPLSSPLPKRRADLIVFGKDIHPHHALYPLLLVECKAVPLTPKVLRQVIGYNQFVRAFFLAVVNQNTILLGYYHPIQKNFCFQEGLPSYEDLLKLK